MSDEKWVTLTPEQVEALDQGVIVRAHRGDVMVQGPLDSVSSAGRCVGIGSSQHARFYSDFDLEVTDIFDTPGLVDVAYCCFGLSVRLIVEHQAVHLSADMARRVAASLNERADRLDRINSGPVEP